MFDQLRENFELILILLFILSAFCYGFYRFSFYRDIQKVIKQTSQSLKNATRKERKSNREKIISQHLNSPFRKIIYFFADLFWVLLFVVAVRSFLYEPFIIPSGSMKPGLQIGDIVLVNKSELGLRLPVKNTRLTQGQKVKRGDVIVFKYPNDPRISYIKRVIGIAGDKAYYDNRKLTINNEPVSLQKTNSEIDSVEVQTGQGITTKDVSYTVYEELLPPDAKHTIRYSDRLPADYPAREWIVPEGKYLVMGDNRDNSADGRAFGLLDDSLLIGHAVRIAFNFDCLKGDGKCDRFFKKIQ